MNVLHFSPELSAAGVSRMAVELAHALQAYGVSSTLASPACELIAPLVQQAPRTMIKHIPFREPGMMGRWGQVVRLARIICTEKPSILHAYGYEAIRIATQACRYVSAARCPRIVGALLGYPSSETQLADSGLSSCDSITVISKSLRQELKKRFPSLIKSWVIPYGVNESHCCPSYRPDATWRENWLASHPELRERYVICLPGPISPQHGTADIVPILSALHAQEIPAHALIVGRLENAPRLYRENLRLSIASAGLAGHITWLTPPENLRDILCAADAVLNLHAEPAAYDRPTLEALALGLPVVGYDHGAVGEYLESIQPMGAIPVGAAEAAVDMLSQWHSLAPEPMEEIPYPYRLSDTVKSYYDLYSTILSSS